MNEFILRQEAVDAFIERLALQALLYAPVNTDGVVDFQPVTQAEEIDLSYQNTAVPPKKLLFPQTETLFSYCLEDDLVIKEPVSPQHETIIFGIRPCDATSFQMLDSVFGGDISDVYYLQKRKQTTLIGLVCQEPCVNCFCTSLGGGPASHDGLDLLLTASENGYFLETFTDKGQALVETTRDFLEEISETQRKKKEHVQQQAEQKIQRSIEVEGTKKKLDALFYDSIWNELAQECIGCSICTYLCPTCHCFDIQDETVGNDGVRIRIWDSCSNPEYTLHASGHNPRPGRMHRTRNRLYHKYNYFPEKYDRIACVGCGRCITKCPVNIDILDMLTKIQAV